MPRYMPQTVFDSLVIHAVKMHVLLEEDLLKACRDICGHYKNSYYDDTGVGIEIEETSRKLLDWGKSFGDDYLKFLVFQLQYCSLTFTPEGKKRRKRLFGGTLFNKDKFRNPDRSKHCLRNMMIYFMGTTSGRFPSVPEGWTVADR